MRANNSQQVAISDSSKLSPNLTAATVTVADEEGATTRENTVFALRNLSYSVPILAIQH